MLSTCLHVCVRLLVCVYGSAGKYGVALPVQFTDCAMLLLLFCNRNSID